MTPASQSGPASIIMLLVGLGIPVMAALNSSLAQRLGSPALASVILFAVALATSSTVLAAGRVSMLPVAGGAPWYLYSGGLIVAAYVISITTLAPRIGIGNAVFLVLLGQLFASAAIDHLGALGVPRTPLTFQRVAGLVLMTLGVALARRPP